MPNQGGTHDQHVKSGQQSQKGSDNKKSAAGSGSRDQMAAGRGSGSEQQGKGGQQGNKNH